MLPPGLTFTELDRLAQMSRYFYGPLAPVYDIHSGDVLVSVKTATVEDAASVIELARKAQVIWQEMGEFRRSSVISTLASIVTDNVEKGAALSQVLAGKSRVDAIQEMLDVVVSSRACSTMSRRVMGAKRRAGLLPVFINTRTSYIPKGVVGFFTLADFPIAYVCDILSAITAGNAVVQFVPAQAVLGAYYARQLFEQAGLPENLWQIVPATSREIGIETIPLLDHVFVVGSTASANSVILASQRQFLPITANLSVKNSAVVLDDANLDKAARELASAAFHCAGQCRIHVEKVFVHERVAERFMAKIKKFTRAQLQIGTYENARATVGSLYSARRLEVARRHVKDAVAKGSTVLTGGNWRPDVGPFFFEPTILTNVNPECDVFHEETYGPVLIVQTFSDLGDVLAAINRCKFSYVVSVYTRSMRIARQITENITVGGVVVNDSYQALYGSWKAPIGFAKESGNGLTHGVDSVYQYTRSVSVARLKGISLIPQVPSDRRSQELSVRVVKFQQAFTSAVVYSPLVRSIRAGLRRIRETFSTTV